MTILDAMTDPALFGRWFKGPTWDAWRAFLAALFALPMDDAGVEVYRRHTGRTEAPTILSREGWVVVGRRGGKSRIAALVAVWCACFRDYRAHLAPGEVTTVAVIAADRRQARTVMRYITGFLDMVPMLARMVTSQTRETIELDNRVVIEIHTASFRSTRGYTLAGCIADEVAFWRSEDSANPDVEIINGLRPGLATIPGALLLGISSPYARKGALWEAYRKHYGQDGDPVLVWQADTASMNPAVPAHVIAEAYAEDPIAAAAEYGAEFRRDVETFVSREVVDACVVPGRVALPPAERCSYRAFVDPSGGSQDAMTLAIAHEEGGRVIVDALAERRPPFSPESVVQEFAALLREYRISSVDGDFYGGQWPGDRFRTHGISYQVAGKPKSALYAEALPLLTAGRVELPENRRLVVEMLGLERRTARGGRDSIDHGPRGHDDLVNAVCGVLVMRRPNMVTTRALAM